MLCFGTYFTTRECTLFSPVSMETTSTNLLNGPTTRHQMALHTSATVQRGVTVSVVCLPVLLLAQDQSLLVCYHTQWLHIEPSLCFGVLQATLHSTSPTISILNNYWIFLPWDQGPTVTNSLTRHQKYLPRAIEKCLNIFQSEFNFVYKNLRYWHSHRHKTVVSILQ